MHPCYFSIIENFEYYGAFKVLNFTFNVLVILVCFFHFTFLGLYSYSPIYSSYSLL